MPLNFSLVGSYQVTILTFTKNYKIVNLLVDYISENRVRAVTNNPDKVTYNLDIIPELKENVAKQAKTNRDAFSVITVSGRWLIVYTANTQDDENTVMHFVDFRIEIDENTMGHIFSMNTINGMKSLQLRYDNVFTRRYDTVELQLAPSFSQDLIKEWESELGINFAIALARKTGWILHTDAWINSTDQNESVPESERVNLRVYVGDNMDNIFDVRGVMKFQEFYNTIIDPLAKRKAKLPKGSVSTRFYTEEQLFELPLGVKPDETKISKATAAIEDNKMFVESITKRQHPLIPAHTASKFTYGLCGPFAEALHALTKLPITAMVATKYTPQFENSRLGYIHSFILHPDGHGEDSWGKQTIEQIAERFGAAEYELSEKEHTQAVDRLKSNSAERYEDAYKEAENVIREYWSA